jgi:hypothetical protein
MIVHSRMPGRERDKLQRYVPAERTTLLYCPDRSGPDAWYAGYKALRAKLNCGFWVFLDEHDFLLPTYLERIGQVFAHRPEVGLVSVWTERPGRCFLEAPLCPEPKYKLRNNDLTPAAAFRGEALKDILPLRGGLRSDQAITRVADAVMNKGWLAVAYPEILARRRLRDHRLALDSLRARLLNLFGEAILRERRGLMNGGVPTPLGASDLGSLEHESLTALVFLSVGIIVRHWRRVARAISQKGRTLLNLTGGRSPLERPRILRSH